MRAILRYDIGLDGAWRTYDLTGEIVHVDARHDGGVEFWVLADDSKPSVPVQLLVLGTGHGFPPDGAHVGTAVTPSHAFVWHLVRRVES